jgi:hypothetical protein
MIKSNDYDGGSFETINCVDVWIDKPGDSTVRPIRPSLLEQAKDARELYYGSREPGPVPPELLEKLLAEFETAEVFISSTDAKKPRDSDKTGNG